MTRRLPGSLLILALSLFIGCKNAQHFATEGIQHLEANRDVSALTFFEKALDKDSDNPLANYGKGRILIQREITREMGQKMLKKSIKGLQSEERKEKASLILANSYYENKQFEKAIKILEKAIKKKFASVRLYNNLSLFYLEMGEKEKAQKTLEDSVQKFPDNHDSYYNLALLIAKEKSDYKKAYELFQKANELKAEQPDILYNLMSVTYRLKKRKEALQYLDLLLKVPMKFKKFQDLKNLKKKIEKGTWNPSKN